MAPLTATALSPVLNGGCAEIGSVHGVHCQRPVWLALFVEYRVPRPPVDLNEKSQ